jgi:hypothetical protein
MTPGIKSISLLLFSIFIIASCHQDTPAKKKIVNPNGDSELALLMREMFDHSMEVKAQLENEGKLDPIKRYDEMKTAEATEPEKAASDLYKAMADTYLSTVDLANGAPPSHRKKAFNSMVDNCMSCHQQLCPGPMVKIEKLYISSDAETLN